MSPEQENLAANFFDGFAETFDTLYDQQRGPFMRWVDQKFRSDIFVRYTWTFARMGSLDGLRVVDIGCGSGPYMVEALRRGAVHVTGVDAAPGMIELAGRRIKQSGQTGQTSLIEGLFPAVNIDPHDHAIVMGVLDYVHDPLRFLKSLRTVITQTAQVSFPSTHWCRTHVRRFRYRMRNCPVYFFSEAQIEAVCRQAGFTDFDIRKIPGAGMDFHVCMRP